MFSPEPPDVHPGHQPKTPEFQPPASPITPDVVKVDVEEPPADPNAEVLELASSKPNSFEPLGTVAVEGHAEEPPVDANAEVLELPASKTFLHQWWR